MLMYLFSYSFTFLGMLENEADGVGVWSASGTREDKERVLFQISLLSCVVLE